MSDAETIEQFHGVYMLYCQNPKYKGRIYIGYTVDPIRRIKQHNKGKQFGGAWKTSKKGPWSMVIIIHGFPNDISALRFEWAWQHPHVSRRLKHVPKKRPKESLFEFHFRVLSKMLSAIPWCRLPLIVRWLNPDFMREFVCENIPPQHIIITSGAVISKKMENHTQNYQAVSPKKCHFCDIIIEEKSVKCLNIICDLTCHITCLANRILEPGEYVPVEGKCPKCNKLLLWGDLVRKYKGYDQISDITISLEEEFVMLDD